MKIIAFLLAMMVLALSCVPCMDGAYVVNYNEAITNISASAHQEQHTDADNCSPFCTCNCCSGFTLVFNCYQPAPSVLPATEKVAIHLPAKISNIALPIWQPPRLG